jgi:hypothetical protein
VHRQARSRPKNSPSQAEPAPWRALSGDRDNGDWRQRSHETAAICSLRDDGTEIGVGGGTAAPSGQLSGSVTLNGVSDGGSVTLVCSQAIAQPTISKNQVITAVRVNTVTQ